MSVESQGPQVGADEWVARQARRREYLPSWLGSAQRAGERVGWWPRLAVAGLAAVVLPSFGLGGFQDPVLCPGGSATANGTVPAACSENVWRWCHRP